MKTTKNDSTAEILKHNQKDNPLNYISKWVRRLKKEAAKAEGYTVGEKQVVLMNLHKVQVELEVARLILKDFLNQALTLQHESDIQAFEEMLVDEDHDYAWENPREPEIARNRLRAELRKKLDELLK